MGRLSLAGERGEDESLGKRRLKLALLAMLAVSRRPFPREVLVDTFWGDQDEEHARHSLSDALSHLRRVLGKDAIATRASEVALDPRAALSVDALDLAEAASAGDHVKVIELYRGPFLDGVHVERSPRFEHWVSRERERLERAFLQSVSPACRALAQGGDLERWAAAAERWVDVAPSSAEAARNWLAALAAPGTRAALDAALRGYDAWRARAEGDGRVERDAALEDEVAGYRARLADIPVGAPPRHAARRPDAPYSPGWRALFGAAIAVLLLVVGVIALRIRRAPPSPSRPVLAVMALRNVEGDSASAWLADGLQQMLIADLARAQSAGGGPLAVIDPSLLRDAVRRKGLAREDVLTTDEAVKLGLDLGATWVVTGGVTHGQGVFVVDVTVRRAADGAALQVYSVSGNDVLTVADRAAARILSAVDTYAKGPRLAEVETGNVEAYQHFIRAIQAGQEGRNADVGRELDAAIALDSGFASAIVQRMRDAALANDMATVNRLEPLLRRAGSRVMRWDRLELAAHAAEHNGEHDRAEALGRELIGSYPGDPRGYEVLANVLTNHGKWKAADSVLQGLLALDSLAAAAGSGPCVPCEAYGGMSDLRVIEGDLAGAERATRRWIALQPNLPGPWRDLSTELSFEGRYASALEAIQRAIVLSGGDPLFTYRIGAIRLLARDYRGVDSLIALWRHSSDTELRSDAGDLKAMAERERGQFRASNATFAALIREDTTSSSMQLVMANSMARLGRRVDGARLYERIERFRATHDVPSLQAESPLQSMTGDRARAFAWDHALQAEAIGGRWAGDVAPQVDTVRLNLIADSMDAISPSSYYGRDWHLASHVRGLVAMAGGRYDEAARDFQAARWGVGGWTATEAELAQAYLALGRADSALGVLRDAYKAPLDAMGRYVPRSELDFLMALAFAQKGMRDSAAVYAGYVRTAWASADPEVRRRLARLPA